MTAPAMTGIPRVNGEGWASSLKMTRDYLRDPLGVMRGVYERHGPVAQMNLFGMRAVVLLGPDANEQVLLDRDEAFSSELGWTPVVGRTFPRGLISIDGTAHRDDRRMIGAAFKPEPMRRYVAQMSAEIAVELSWWPEELAVYPAVKRLTLDLATRTLLGLPFGRQAREVSRALVAMLGASTAIIRRPVPGGALWRGMRARRRLIGMLTPLIAARRAQRGPDIFSEICHARDEQGKLLAEEAIIDHVNLLVMAAHDTTTSALTSIVYMLGLHPQWQDRVRDELAEARRLDCGQASYERMRHLPVTDLVLNETLRCMPPVPSLPRGLAKDVFFGGHLIPAGTSVGIHILHTHHMPELWPEPDRFDPLRFTPERVRERHKYAWLPFGGGAHMCLGLHFASMQVKLFLSALLARRRIELLPGYVPQMQWLPIPRPRDGLRVRLARG